MIVFTVLIAVLSVVYYISQRKFDYWKKKNVPYLKPTPIFGNYGPYILMKKCFANVSQEILRKFPNEPYVGTYFGTEPALLLQDPEMVKLVMTKDFYYFNGREVTKYADREILTKSLFFQGGDIWKVSRQNLTPLFSSAKMKNMFPLIRNCAFEFEKLLDQDYAPGKVVHIHKQISKFTMACICSCAFGVDSNTLENDTSQNVFTNIGEDIFKPTFLMGFYYVARAIWPAIFYGLGFKNFPTSIVNFFNSLLTKVFKNRDYKPTGRNDFIDLLLQLRENKYIVGDSMSNRKTGGDQKVQIPVIDNYMISHCGLFFAAGYETSATTFTHTILELAKHPEILKKVQKEIDAFLVKHDNKLVYECVTELPYTEMCIDETLRLYPVQGVLAREVMDDYVFPTGLSVSKGMRMHIPVYSLHRNPQFFPEPEKFRPERFSPEERRNIVSHTYMPFGDGPRICIGMRFAKMQMLAGIVTLLKKYDVELAEYPNPELDPRTLVLTMYDEVKIRLTIREDWEQRVFAE